MIEIGEILNEKQSELFEQLGLGYAEIVAMEDADLLSIPGIGPSTIKKIREYVTPEPVVEKKDAKGAVSMRYLVIKDGDFRVNIAPGDEIPAKFAEEQVAQGKARWR